VEEGNMLAISGERKRPSGWPISHSRADRALSVPTRLIGVLSAVGRKNHPLETDFHILNTHIMFVRIEQYIFKYSNLKIYKIIYIKNTYVIEWEIVRW
jgi:hypothetical protein